MINNIKNVVVYYIIFSPSTIKVICTSVRMLLRLFLKNGVRISSTKGAMIKHIWDEMAVFDLKSFANIILCIGGNDASKTDAETYEQKYDELIGYIKAANSECTIYLCNVVPRGDVDVTAINSSIERVAGLW